MNIQSHNISLDFNQFSKNDYNSSFGAAVYFINSYISINNTQFLENTAYSGGAVYLIDCEFLYIQNTLIAENIAITSGGGIMSKNSVILL